jgi:hypothetical protein
VRRWCGVGVVSTWCRRGVWRGGGDVGERRNVAKDWERDDQMLFEGTVTGVLATERERTSQKKRGFMPFR